VLRVLFPPAPALRSKVSAIVLKFPRALGSALPKNTSVVRVLIQKSNFVDFPVLLTALI